MTRSNTMTTLNFLGSFILLYPIWGRVTLVAQSDTATIQHKIELRQHEKMLLRAAKISTTGEADVALQDSSDRRLLLVVRVKTGEAKLHNN
jgi:hypothetical protein